MTTDARPEPADEPEAKPPATGPWYQFSVRAQLLWVAVVGVLLAVGLRWIAPAQRQRAAVQMVERLGGEVMYFMPPEVESHCTAWLREWLPRDYFDAVEEVDLGNASTPLTEADLRSLAAFTQLQVLWLSNTQVTDAELAHLSGLTKLQSLGLSHAELTDVGLTHLSGLTKLQRLRLDSTQVTDTGVAELNLALPDCSIGNSWAFLRTKPGTTKAPE